ncbi:MAG: hypothetical protein RIT28_2268, partial [Pseudomonadota bacterium]
MARLTPEQLLTLLPETRPLLRAALGGAGDAALSPGVSPVAEVLDGGGALRFPGLSARLALTLFDAHAEWASGLSDLEADQGFDATVRLYGLALAATSASSARGAAWLSTPEGQRLAQYVAAVEIALAFSTDGDLPLDFRPSELVLTFGDDARDALSGALGGLPGDVGDTLRAMLPTLDALARDAAADSARLADALRAALGPQPSNRREDLAAEAARWPVYRLLWPSGGASPVVAAPAPAAPPAPPARPRVDLARVNDLRDQLTLTLERREALALTLDEAEASLEALPSARTPSEDRAPVEQALTRARDARRVNQRAVDAAVEAAWSAEGALGEAEERLERALAGARRAEERRAALPRVVGSGVELEAERAAAVACRSALDEASGRVDATRAALRATAHAALTARSAQRAALISALTTTSARHDAIRLPEVTTFDPGDSPADQAEAARASFADAGALEATLTEALDVAEARLAEAERVWQAASARVSALGERREALAATIGAAQADVTSQRSALGTIRSELEGLRASASARRAALADHLGLVEARRAALQVPDASAASPGELGVDPRPAWQLARARREAAVVAVGAAEAAAQAMEAAGGASARGDAEARRASARAALGEAESRRVAGLAALAEARAAAEVALAERRALRARLAALLSTFESALGAAPAPRALAEAPPPPDRDPTLPARLEAARAAQRARSDDLAAAESRLSAASARLTRAQATLADRHVPAEV